MRKELELNKQLDNRRRVSFFGITFTKPAIPHTTPAILLVPNLGLHEIVKCRNVPTKPLKCNNISLKVRSCRGKS
jgi:hypothetical protein